MGASREAAAAHVAEHLLLPNLLTDSQVGRVTREVGVVAHDPVVVAHLDQAAEATGAAAVNHGPLGDRPDGRPAWRGVVDPVVSAGHLEDGVAASVGVGRADPRVLERRREELPLDRRAVGSVVACPAILAFEVEHLEFAARPSPIATREDPTRADVVLPAVAGLAIESLIEDVELVTGPRAAGEVELPGEDGGEGARQRRLLAKRVDRLVQAAVDRARQAHDVGHQLVLVVDRLVLAVRGSREVNALVRTDPIVELQQTPALVDDEAIGLPRLGLVEVEQRQQLARDGVDRTDPDTVTPQRRGQRLAARELASDHLVDRFGSRRVGETLSQRQLGRQRVTRRRDDDVRWHGHGRGHGRGDRLVGARRLPHRHGRLLERLGLFEDDGGTTVPRIVARTETKQHGERQTEEGEDHSGRNRSATGRPRIQAHEQLQGFLDPAIQLAPTNALRTRR